jgi:hypothetical protein
MPDIGEFRTRLREQQGAHNRTAVRTQLRCPVGREDRHMSAEPGCVVAAAGEAPGSGQPIAAGYRPSFGGTRWAPRDDPAFSAKDFESHFGIEMSRGHRTTAGLAQAPGGAGVVLGDFLDHRDIGCGAQFSAAEGTRQQQAEQSALRQRLDDRIGQLATALDFLGRYLELGAEFPRAPQVIDIGRLSTLRLRED